MLRRLRTSLPVHPTMRHPRTGAPVRAIGLVRGRPVFPVMGGAPDDADAAAKAAADQAAADKAASDKAAADAAAEAARAAAAAQGDKGFPENTPVAEMTDKQAAAYWKWQSRKHEDTVKARADYDDLKKKAAEADKLRKERETENEKAIREASEKAAADGAELAAGQRLVGLLVARGKTEDEADGIVDDLNLTRYVKDGKPDRDAIAKAVERLAPAPAKEDGKKKFPDLGQGKRDGAGKPSVASGREMFEQRRGNKKAADA